MFIIFICFPYVQVLFCPIYSHDCRDKLADVCELVHNDKKRHMNHAVITNIKSYIVQSSKRSKITVRSNSALERSTTAYTQLLRLIIYLQSWVSLALYLRSPSFTWVVKGLQFRTINKLHSTINFYEHICGHLVRIIRKQVLLSPKKM